MSDKPVNAADEDQVRDRQRNARELAKQQREDLLTLLGMAEFRRYLWRHLNETCGVMRSASSPNGSQQSLNLGMQDVGRRLWAETEAVDPLAIPKMMTEYFEAQQKA